MIAESYLSVILSSGIESRITIVGSGRAIYLTDRECPSTSEDTCSYTTATSGHSIGSSVAIIEVSLEEETTRGGDAYDTAEMICYRVISRSSETTATCDIIGEYLIFSEGEDEGGCRETCSTPITDSLFYGSIS